jgi:hypothetical protein
MATTRQLSPVAKALIGIAGSIVSLVVTIQLKKMLERRGLSDRYGDVKESLKNAGASASDLKDTIYKVIGDKTTSAANKAAQAAQEATEKLNG